KFVYLGASAGGHLALLQGYKHTTPVMPKAIVSFFGPTDIADLYNNPGDVPAYLIAELLGGTPTANPDMYFQSSPVNFVSNSSSPTIILQGGADPVVPPAQQEILLNQLTAHNVTKEYVFYPDEGHGWNEPLLSDSFEK